MPVVLVRAPWAFALSMRRLHREVWYKLRRVALRTLYRRWLEGLVKACVHCLSAFGIVHQGVVMWPSVDRWRAGLVV